jgi:hypothetical protein
MIGGSQRPCGPEQKPLNGQKRHDRNRCSDNAAHFITDPTRHIEQDDHAECHPWRTQAPHGGVPMIADPEKAKRASIQTTVVANTARIAKPSGE